MAVARCQQRLADAVENWRKRGIVVHFGIHPVAGRLPGHMNVLLAEAKIPYDIVYELEDINPQITTYDVAIVLGANDIVNPDTQSQPSSPIYGMPVLEVWKCKTCVVMKRGMSTGYSGVDNPLFYKKNARLFFGDAKKSVDLLVTETEKVPMTSGPASAGLGVQGPPQRDEEEEAAVESFPEPAKTLGFLVERRPGETRVALVPRVIHKVRAMGFAVVMENGAGVRAAFTDQMYKD